MIASFRRRLGLVRRAARTTRALSAMDDDELLAIVQLGKWLAEDHVRPRRAAAVHRDAWVSPLASIRFGARVVIGSKAAVGPFASVWGGFETAFARIGDEAQIGPGALIVAGNHRVDGVGPVRRLGFDEADVTVGPGAWIGANAVVIGCEVGPGAVIGAGAVVTTDIPERAVAYGAPARVVRMRGDA